MLLLFHSRSLVGELVLIFSLLNMRGVRGSIGLSLLQFLLQVVHFQFVSLLLFEEATYQLFFLIELLLQVLILFFELRSGLQQLSIRPCGSHIAYSCSCLRSWLANSHLLLLQVCHTIIGFLLIVVVHHRIYDLGLLLLILTLNLMSYRIVGVLSVE